MKVIIPVKMTDLKLTDTNLTEADHSLWSNVTSYSRGDYSISVDTHTIYRSLTDTNLDNDPDLEQVALADPLIEDPATINWQVIGATNRWKAFDQKPSVQATNADTIMLEISPGEFVGGLAGSNITGTSVDITGTTVGEGVVYSNTIDLYEGTEVSDWYTYFFEALAPVTEFAVTDLPPYADTAWEVTINNPGGIAGVGQIVIGAVQPIGEVVTPGTSLTGLDFSYVQNDEFGNLSRVKREATRLADFEIVIANIKIFTIFETLRILRGGEPAVWVGEERAEYAAIIYGFARDYRLVYQGGTNSILSLQIQGMV